jgi:hypothetical protein
MSGAAGAARAAGSARTAWATRAAGASIARRSTSVAPARASTTIAIARIEGVSLHALRSRSQIDQVEKLAAFLRSRWRGLALDHAHQTNLGHAPADDVERLHQSAEPVALNLKRGTHGFRLGPTAKIRRRGRFRLRLGPGFTSTAFARRSLGARRGTVRGCLRGDRLTLGDLRRGRAFFSARAFDSDRHGLDLGRRSSCLRVLCPVGPLGLCRPLQQDSGKLGDGLHGVRPSLRVNQGRFSRMQRPS